MTTRRLVPLVVALFCLLLLCGAAGAVEIPHGTVQVIDAEFAGAYDVCAADIDGDGDLDVVGAAVTADDILWWENTSGNGPPWTVHTVEADFDGVSAVP